MRVILAVVLSLSTATATASTIVGRVSCLPLRDNANVVVFLARSLDQPDKKFLPPIELVVMDQRNLTFRPHVLPVLSGTRVAFRNSDELRHNVFSPSEAKRFNLGTYPQGSVKHVVFDQPGEVALLCNVHREMSAYIVVTETPFFAVTDEQGRFRIDSVPPGRYLLKTWHEQLVSIQLEINLTGPTLEINIDLKK